MNQRLVRGALVGAVIFTVSACGPNLPPLVAEGEHVRLHMFEPAPPGLIDWLDTVARSYGDYLGVSDPAVDLYVFADAGVACGLPSGAIAGCATGHEVWTTTPYHAHEIVHAVATDLGEPPLWLTEGLANAIGGALWGRGSGITPTAELASWLTTDGWNASGVSGALAHYDPSASFVRHLIRSHGIEVVLALYAELRREADGAEQRAVFERIVGASLDAEIEVWIAEGPQDGDAVLEPVPECSSPPLQLSETVEITPGPRTFFYSGNAVAFRTLDLVERSRISYGWTPSSSDLVGSIRVYGCATPIDYLGTPVRRLDLPRSLGVLDLDPGRYLFVTGAADAMAEPPSSPVNLDVGATIEPLASCPASPISIDETELVFLNPGSSLSFDACPDCEARYSLVSSVARMVEIRPADGISPAPTVEVFSCGSPCDAVTGCAPLSPSDGSVAVAVDPGVPLHIVVRPLGDDATFNAQLRVSSR